MEKSDSVAVDLGLYLGIISINKEYLNNVSVKAYIDFSDLIWISKVVICIEL